MPKRATIPVDPAPKPDSWVKKHLSTIGGTAAATIMGKGYESKASLWDRMHAVLIEDRMPPPVAVSDDMRRGTILEPFARAQLAKHYGVDVEAHRQDRFVVRDNMPWAHALPDGIMPVGRPIELKVPRPGTVAKAAMHGLPERWRIQAIHTMLVMGVTEWMPVALLDPISLRLHVFETEYDAAFAAELAEAERAFFASIYGDQRPDDTPTVREAEPGDLVKIATPEIAEAAASWNQLKGIKDDLDGAIEDARERLRALAKAVDEGITAFEVPGLLRVYDRPLPGRKLLDKDYLTKTYPEAARDPKCWKTSAPSRPFKTYNLEER